LTGRGSGRNWCTCSIAIGNKLDTDEKNPPGLLLHYQKLCGTKKKGGALSFLVCISLNRIVFYVDECATKSAKLSMNIFCYLKRSGVKCSDVKRIDVIYVK